jgi:hypothetical protein
MIRAQDGPLGFDAEHKADISLFDISPGHTQSSYPIQLECSLPGGEEVGK